MFLPAKFDSNDGLQRLGLAYMTKAGGSAIPQIPSSNTHNAPSYKSDSTSTSATATTAKEPAKKRKRRQSAPASAAFKDAASRAAAANGAADDGPSAGGGRSKKRISLGLAKVDEDPEKA